jgi:imidazolonepropionase-like amidohydrolase
LCASAFGADLAVVGGKVFPSPGAAPLLNTTVLIHDGKIAAVGQNVAIPSGATKLTCTGCFVFAGFWNSHVHFTEPKWSTSATKPASALTKDVQAMLTHSGFTTVVDLGSDLRTTLPLRHRIDAGEVPGPRIFTAGSPLYPPAGVPYYLSDLPPEIRAILPQPSTPAEAEAIVKQNIAAGADLLKLFTGSYVTRDHIKPMSLDIARAAVTVAHANHQIAFAHPSNLEGVRVAMESGVDVLAHAPSEVEGIDDKLIADLVAHRMSMIPTLKLFSESNRIPRIREIVSTFHRHGGRLLFGTDTGFVTNYDLTEEYRQLALAGLSFEKVLAMLTTAPVACLGLKQEGLIAVGQRGDLTILSADPTQDLTAFTKVRYTVRGGRVIFNRR